MKRLLQRSIRFLNVLIIVSMLVGLIPPGALTPGGVRVAHAQEPTETPALSPTNGPTEEPTPTETPTDTPVPTETPAPTETPTEAPTPALSPTTGPTLTITPPPPPSAPPAAVPTATATPSADVGDYAILGLNSVWLQQGSDLYSGHVGVQDASPGPVLDSDAEVTIGHDVTFHDPTSAIAGDTVKLEKGAAVLGWFNYGLK